MRSTLCCCRLTYEPRTSWRANPTLLKPKPLRLQKYKTALTFSINLQAGAIACKLLTRSSAENLQLIDESKRSESLRNHVQTLWKSSDNRNHCFRKIWNHLSSSFWYAEFNESCEFAMFSTKITSVFISINTDSKNLKILKKFLNFAQSTFWNFDQKLRAQNDIDN